MNFVVQEFRTGQSRAGLSPTHLVWAQMRGLECPLAGILWCSQDWRLAWDDSEAEWGWDCRLEHFRAASPGGLESSQHGNLKEVMLPYAYPELQKSEGLREPGGSHVALESHSVSATKVSQGEHQGGDR